MNGNQIKAEVEDLKETQAYKRTFDFVRSIICKAGTADSVTIPINNAGDFYQLGYNIRYTKNSLRKVDDGNGGTVDTPICATKLKFRSQAANNVQSNDFIPVQLISTPGADDMPRYGTRPFAYVYPKGDSLVIEYDNRAPQSLAGETYEMHDEQIDICINGKLYITD